METRKNDLVKLVNEAKEEVEYIKKSRVESKEAIDEIDSLKKRLDAIKRALEPKQKSLNERISNLDLILEKLSDLKFDLILKEREQIFNVIEKNLLDGMSLKNVESDENIKLIVFNKKITSKGKIQEDEENEVGYIEFLGKVDRDIKIRVVVYNNTEDFSIKDILKMYSIISFINTKFNYKQE